jgi:hypothetical protein
MDIAYCRTLENSYPFGLYIIIRLHVLLDNVKGVLDCGDFALS